MSHSSIRSFTGTFSSTRNSNCEASFSASPPNDFPGSSASAIRKAFRFCFLAPVGNLLQAPQARHLTTSTSAQGLRPPLLRFSVVRKHVCPSINGELQILQMLCFNSLERRICPFCAMMLRCAVSWRGRPEGGGLKVAVLGWPGVGFLLAWEVVESVASVPGGWRGVWVAASCLSSFGVPAAVVDCTPPGGGLVKD